MNRGGLAACVLVIAACQPQGTAPQSSEIEFLNLPGQVESGQPFSTAVRVDNMIYLSGVIGVHPTELRPVDGGIEAETRRAMEIIRERVEAFGSSMDRIVKCTAFLVDENDRAAMNEVYRSHFETPPARSGVTVAGIALGARMELECIAVVK
ncbi:MAG: Rid family hydrolase [Gemmatimonadota bacterium]